MTLLKQTSRFIFAFVFLTASMACAAQIPKEAEARVAPYLMPKDHPIKDELDAFFKRGRCTFCEESLQAAGFSNWTPRQFTRVIVARHPQFPGYIFKIYLDVQRHYKDLPEWEHWALRAEGAKLVRKEIEKQGLQAYFKAPHKWIYKLPRHPKPKKGYLAKHYILVQEDMELLSDKENQEKWKSDEINQEWLTLLYVILDKLELYDCAKIHNAPFSKDGRIAFIDTESFYKGTVKWESLNNMLNPANKKFWMELTEQ